MDDEAHNILHENCTCIIHLMTSVFVHGAISHCRLQERSVLLW